LFVEREGCGDDDAGCHGDNEAASPSQWVE